MLYYYSFPWKTKLNFVKYGLIFKGVLLAEGNFKKVENFIEAYRLRDFAPKTWVWIFYGQVFKEGMTEMQQFF